MNLIEKLGGYELAKSVYSELKHKRESFTHKIACENLEFDVGILRLELLEHRRANNIYEVGDYALPNSDHSNEVHFLSDWYIKDLDFRYKTKSGGWGVIVKSCMSTAWRHATDEEIKAGHRISHATDNPSHFDHCTDIRNHVSPNTVVTER